MVDRPAPLSVCVDLPDLLSLFVASDRRSYQLYRRMVLAGEGLSHAGGVRRSEMEDAERTDAVVGELQQRADTWSESAGFVFGQHVSYSVHAPSTTYSMGRGRIVPLFITVSP